VITSGTPRSGRTGRRGTRAPRPSRRGRGGRGHDPDVDRDRLRAADPHQLALCTRSSRTWTAATARRPRRGQRPRCACSNQPLRCAIAPVNEPRSWPTAPIDESGDSAPQLTRQNGPSQRTEPSWITRAITPCGAGLASRSTAGRWRDHATRSSTERRPWRAPITTSALVRPWREFSREIRANNLENRARMARPPRNFRHLRRTPSKYRQRAQLYRPSDASDLAHLLRVWCAITDRPSTTSEVSRGRRLPPRAGSRRAGIRDLAAVVVAGQSRRSTITEARSP